MNLNLNLATTAAAFLAANAVGSGACPGFEPVADLDLDRYSGTWYEVTRDKDNKYETNQNCVLVDYSRV